MKGRVYCRRTVRATVAGAAAFRSSTVVVSTGWLLSQAARLAFVGQRLAGAPRRALAQGGEPGLRRRFGLGDDAGEAAVPHDGNDAGNCARTRLVERGQLGARRRRLQHAAVQQAGQAQIVHEARPAEHLVGQVEPCRRRARDPPRVGRLGRRRRGWHRAPEGRRRPAPNSWCAGCPGRRWCRPATSRLSAATPRRWAAAAQIDRARLRGRVAHGRARLLDRQAARGGALVGAGRGRGRDHADAVRDRCRARRPRSAPAR